MAGHSEADIRRDLLAHLESIRHGTGDLPSQALSRPDRVYHVSGRVGEYGGDGIAELVSGNPIDVIGGYMLRDDFFSTGNPERIKTNSHQYRMLTSLDEGTATYKFDNLGPIEYEFNGQVLVPKPIPVKIREVEPIEFLQDLKQADTFQKEAQKYMTEGKAHNLTSHLFE